MASPLRASAFLRLAAGIAGIALLIALIGLGVQYRTVKSAMYAQQEALLQADLEGLAALYEQRRIIALRQALDFRTTTGAADGGLYLLLDKSGGKLAGNLDAWPGDLPAVGQGFTTEALARFTGPEGDYIGVGRVLRGGFPLLVARSLAPVEETLSNLRSGIWVLAFALLLASLVAGTGAARLVMQRIDRINALADRVAAGEIGARLPGPPTRDEFGLLETHFHRMLDRIEGLQRATRQLSDAIAHELRSPLNRIQSKLARLPDSPQTAEAKEELRNTVRIFDSLLDIAGAEAQAGQAPGLRPLDLAQVCAEVHELYLPVAEDRGLTFTQALPDHAFILGDRNLVAQLVSNLVDNALKYTRPGDAITLSLVTEGDRHVMAVRDTGPGVPEGLGDQVFDRFTRGERDRHIAGHGLGLALVRAIATRHGARTAITQMEKGFAIEVAWPTIPAPAAA